MKRPISSTSEPRKKSTKVKLEVEGVKVKVEVETDNEEEQIKLEEADTDDDEGEDMSIKKEDDSDPVPEIICGTYKMKVSHEDTPQRSERRGYDNFLSRRSSSLISIPNLEPSKLRH